MSLTRLDAKVPQSDERRTEVSSLDSPDNKKHGDSQDEVVGLVIEQVANDSVVPSGQIPNIRFGESLLARVEIVPRPERRQLHFSHDRLGLLT